MNNQRTFDYVSDLHASIDRKKSQPFVWGENDCVLFAADVIKDTTLLRIDVASEDRGQYKTKEEAEKHLASKYGDLYQAWDSKLPRRENPMAADQGDPVLFMTDEGLTCGIFDLNAMGPLIWAPGPKGAIAFNVSYANILASWEV